MRYKIGEIYTGIGFVGETQDKTIKGVLVDYNAKDNTAQLRVSIWGEYGELNKKIEYVIFKTLKPFE